MLWNDQQFLKKKNENIVKEVSLKEDQKKN